MMSTAPFAILVIDGGVTRVRLRIVGWIENGFTPLSISALFSLFEYLYSGIENVLNRLGWTSTNIHLDLNDMIDRRSRIALGERIKETITSVFRRERVGVGY